MNILVVIESASGGDRATKPAAAATLMTERPMLAYDKYIPRCRWVLQKGQRPFGEEKGSNGRGQF